jgi:hypothetical protein
MIQKISGKGETMKSTKQKISDAVVPVSAKSEAKVPFFARNLDEEALRSIQAGDGDARHEVQVKLAQG